MAPLSPVKNFKPLLSSLLYCIIAVLVIAVSLPNINFFPVLPSINILPFTASASGLFEKGKEGGLKELGNS